MRTSRAWRTCGDCPCDDTNYRVKTVTALEKPDSFVTPERLPLPSNSPLNLAVIKSSKSKSKITGQPN